MARVILEERELTVVDEFTSVVDRTVAKIGSAAIQKVVRRKGKKLVALSCHYDISEWLEPDWIYDVANNYFKWVHLRRPKIKLEIFQCHRKAWGLFKGHHYLTAEISKAAHCYVALIDGEPVGFTSAVHFPHPKVRNMWRGHRTVVLPDFQGVGIGNLLSETMAEHYKSQGKRFSSTTSHPAMIAYRTKSPKWAMTRKPSRVSTPVTETKTKITSSFRRLTASFEYIGECGQGGRTA